MAWVGQAFLPAGQTRMSAPAGLGTALNGNTRMTLTTCPILLAACAVVGVVLSAAADEPKKRDPVKLTDEALRLHKEALVFDGHNDLPWQFREKGELSFTHLDISRDQKALFQHAAELQGRTLTDFVIASVNDAAVRAIEEAQTIRLSAKDSRAFAEALLNPREQTARLKAAAQRYLKLAGG